MLAVSARQPVTTHGGTRLTPYRTPKSPGVTMSAVANEYWNAAR
jgi:hypothetical protein